MAKKRAQRPAATKLEWHTETRRVRDLIPADKNPNINSDADFAKLKASIKRDGYVEIIVIDIDGRIPAGNHRHRALMELGMGDREIDVRVPNRKLTETEFNRYLIASNALHGDFDFDVLREYDPELWMQLLRDEDLEHAFGDLLGTEDDHADLEEELKKAAETDIKPGDMFQLGRHRLGCIDSRDAAAVEKLIGTGNRVDLINIDFPYNVGVDYGRGLGGKQHYGGTINDRKTDAEYYQFLLDITRNALAAAKDDCHVFLWLDEKFLGMFERLFKECRVKQRRLCMWVKDSLNPVPKVAFNRAVELCWYGTRGSPYLSDSVLNLNEFLNKDIASGARVGDDIADLFQLWFAKRVAGVLYQHPTMKPISLYEKSLRRCSRPGDTVLDLCAGSGSLLLACEAMHRVAIAADVEPVFCQVAINRFKNLSHEPVKKLH
ncbi:MAG: DNA modification methylase [Patescibacteria group bacterium]|nr:ParB N-terminal domain-containing protein [Patescibacteria group bacterium]MDE1944846.1 DNA modification methylase [Patescibacteria group bacterium]MDE2057292.1 DNA modification methylase [Patescibacteria group bacterium]